jgi:hypothetical protein
MFRPPLMKHFKERQSVYRIPNCGKKLPYIDVEVTSNVRVFFTHDSADKSIAESDLIRKIKDLPIDARIRVRANALK